MQHNMVTLMETAPIIAPQQIVQRTIPALELHVDDAVAAKPAVVDMILAGVLIIDSAGLNWLLAVQSRLETLGLRLRLLDPPPIISDVLLATRLDSRFTIAVTGASENHGHGSGGDHGR
jgi:anti-anti-sigma regulatory factor